MRTTGGNEVEYLYEKGVEIRHGDVVIRVQGGIKAVSLYNPNDTEESIYVDYLGEVPPEWYNDFPENGVSIEKGE